MVCPEASCRRGHDDGADRGRDPKWSGKVQTETLEIKLERAWKQADVAAQMHTSRMT